MTEFQDPTTHGSARPRRRDFRPIETREAQLDARSKELGFLQELGQRVAEAPTADRLFDVASETLLTAAGLDAVVVLHALGDQPVARCRLGRPLKDAVLDQLVNESARFLDWPRSALPAPACARSTSYDESGSPLCSIRERDTVMLPVMRRGATVACLTLLRPGGPDESGLRLLFSAANLLSLHVDRMLKTQQAEQDRFRAILDSMPQAVMLTDAGLRIRHANPAALRLVERLDRSADAGRFERLGDLPLNDLVESMKRDGSTESHGEARLDGGEVYAVSLSSYRAASDGTEGYVVVVTDMTQSRRLQDQLAQAEKMSSLGLMISGVAHELNNPLASILGYAQLIQSTATDPDLSERLGIVRKEARRCQRVVGNLLSFARRHEPERKPVSLNDNIRTVIGLMSYQLRVTGIKVEEDLDRSLPVIEGDTHRLQQALLNLVTNAHQAMRDDDGPTKIIRLRSFRDGAGNAVVTVEDTGPGIPKNIRSRVFDPFFTTKSLGEGTGLGLSLVYGTITSHCGSVAVEASPEGGARFVLRLPAIEIVREDGKTTAAGERDDEPPPGSILVVDDESAIADMLRDSLVYFGHRVVVCLDGERALQALEDERFDLLIVDYRMPLMDGRHLHEELHRRDPDLTDRLLLTTGDTVSEEPARFASREGLPVLEKPFDLEDLRRAVSGFLRVPSSSKR